MRRSAFRACFANTNRPRKPCARRGEYVGGRTATGRPRGRRAASEHQPTFQACHSAPRVSHRPWGDTDGHGMIGAARGRPTGRRIATPPRCLPRAFPALGRSRRFHGAQTARLPRNPVQETARRGTPPSWPQAGADRPSDVCRWGKVRGVLESNGKTAGQEATGSQVVNINSVRWLQRKALSIDVGRLWRSRADFTESTLRICGSTWSRSPLTSMKR